MRPRGSVGRWMEMKKAEKKTTIKNETNTKTSAMAKSTKDVTNTKTQAMTKSVPATKTSSAEASRPDATMVITHRESDGEYSETSWDDTTTEPDETTDGEQVPGGKGEKDSEKDAGKKGA